jgi:hypothetical protein
MGRLVDLDDLVSARIVVARLGWRRVQRLHTARERYGFPEPVKTLSRTLLWLWPDVRDWAIGEGWVRWPEPPPLGRALIEPTDIVPASVIVERLGLRANETGDEIPGLEALPRDPSQPALYQWALAELLWHDRANRPLKDL